MKKFPSVEPAKRLANLPKPTYPENLPVVARREEILRVIDKNQVVIICGETGSGKTTLLRLLQRLYLNLSYSLPRKTHFDTHVLKRIRVKASQPETSTDNFPLLL